MLTAACFQRKSATLCNGKLDMWSLCCISTLKKKDNLESVTREGLRFSSCTGTGSVLKNRVFVYPRFPTGRAEIPSVALLLHPKCVLIILTCAGQL